MKSTYLSCLLLLPALALALDTEKFCGSRPEGLYCSPDVKYHKVECPSGKLFACPKKELEICQERGLLKQYGFKGGIARCVPNLGDGVVENFCASKVNLGPGTYCFGDQDRNLRIVCPSGMIFKCVTEPSNSTPKCFQQKPNVAVCKKDGGEGGSAGEVGTCVPSISISKTTVTITQAVTTTVTETPQVITMTEQDTVTETPTCTRTKVQETVVTHVSTQVEIYTPGGAAAGETITGPTFVFPTTQPTASIVTETSYCSSLTTKTRTLEAFISTQTVTSMVMANPDGPGAGGAVGGTVPPPTYTWPQEQVQPTSTYWIHPEQTTTLTQWIHPDQTLAPWTLTQEVAPPTSTRYMTQTIAGQPSTTQSMCPQDGSIQHYIPESTFGKYQFTGQRSSAFDAMATCQSLGADLALAGTEQESTFLSQNLCEPVWIKAGADAGSDFDGQVCLALYPGGGTGST